MRNMFHDIAVVADDRPGVRPPVLLPMLERVLDHENYGGGRGSDDSVRRPQLSDPRRRPDRHAFGERSQGEDKVPAPHNEQFRRVQPVASVVPESRLQLRN